MQQENDNITEERTYEKLVETFNIIYAIDIEESKFFATVLKSASRQINRQDTKRPNNKHRQQAEALFAKLKTAEQKIKEICLKNGVTKPSAIQRVHEAISGTSAIKKYIDYLKSSPNKESDIPTLKVSSKKNPREILFAKTDKEYTQRKLSDREHTFFERLTRLTKSLDEEEMTLNKNGYFQETSQLASTIKKDEKQRRLQEEYAEEAGASTPRSSRQETPEEKTQKTLNRLTAYINDAKTILKFLQNKEQTERAGNTSIEESITLLKLEYTEEIHPHTLSLEEQIAILEAQHYTLTETFGSAHHTEEDDDELDTKVEFDTDIGPDTVIMKKTTERSSSTSQDIARFECIIKELESIDAPEIQSKLQELEAVITNITTYEKAIGLLTAEKQELQRQHKEQSRHNDNAKTDQEQLQKRLISLSTKNGQLEAELAKITNASPQTYELNQ